MSPRFLFPWALLSTCVLSACGGGGGGGGNDPTPPTPPAPTVLTGFFIDSPVAGLNYSTATRSGTTNVQGAFQYLAGERVTFSIGSVELGAATGSSQVTPFTLFGLTPPDDQEQIDALLNDSQVGDFDRVINIVTLLVALDADGNPDNGIDLTGRSNLLGSTSLDFNLDHSSFRGANFQGFLTENSITHTSWQTATDHLYSSLAIELNEAPVFTSSASGSIPENSNVTSYTAAASDANGDSLSYSLSGGTDQARFSINGASGVLSFASAPDFESPTDSNADNIYEVIVQVSDGRRTATQAVNITVVGANDAPVFTSGTVSTAAENSTLTGYTATAQDIEGNNFSFSVVGGADQSKFSIDSSTGVLRFLSAPNFEIPQDSDANNSYEATIQVSDVLGAATTQAVSISVTNVNEAPTVTSGAIGNTAENTTDTGYNVSGTDPDGDSVSFGIANGADGALFSIDSSTGELSFSAAPDYENPLDVGADNVYNLFVEVNDGNLSGQKAVSVSVTNENEFFPEFTSLDTHSTRENRIQTGYTATATDGDNDPISFSITGGADADKFSISSSSGVLSFVVAPDFEVPGDFDANNTFVVQLQASDGSGGTSQQTLSLSLTDEITRLNLKVSYPTPDANLGSVNVESTVTGYVTDDEDGVVTASDIGSLSVNGVWATFSLTDEKKWTVQVPVSTGQNDLSFSLQDVEGDLVEQDQSVINEPLLLSMRRVVLDSANNRLFLIDSNLAGVIELDLSTGDRRILTGGTVGAGPSLTDARAMALDSTNSRLLVADSDLLALVAVDLSTGDRTTVASDSVGSGASVSSAGVALDSTGNRALMTQAALDAIIEVDLDNGNRTILSDLGHGTGTGFDSPTAIAFDSVNDLAFVVDQSFDDIFVVDLNTGNRELLIDNSGSGVLLQTPSDVIYYGATNTLYVIDDGNLALVAINATTGARTRISKFGTIGDGLPLQALSGLAMAESGTQVYATNGLPDALLTIDLATGNRAILSDNYIGTGEHMTTALGITLDSDNQRAIVVNENINADSIVAVDLQSGDRTTLSSNQVGGGITFTSPYGIAFDADSNSALVTDYGQGALFSVNLSTGYRTVLSDGSNTGPALSAPYGVVIDSNNLRALVVDDDLDALVAVDLTTGNRTLLSQAGSTGSGTGFSSPRGLTLDSVNDRVLVTDYSLEALFTVDLSTGDREILSSFGVNGSGEALIRPVSVNLDSANQRAVVTQQSSNVLVAIDLSTGDRTVLSSGTLGLDLSILNNVFSSGVYDVENDRTLVSTTKGAIFTVEVESGEGAVTSW